MFALLLNKLYMTVKILLRQLKCTVNPFEHIGQVSKGKLIKIIPKKRNKGLVQIKKIFISVSFAATSKFLLNLIVLLPITLLMHC